MTPTLALGRCHSICTSSSEPPVRVWDDGLTKLRNVPRGNSTETLCGWVLWCLPHCFATCLASWWAQSNGVRVGMLRQVLGLQACHHVTSVAVTTGGVRSQRVGRSGQGRGAHTRTHARARRQQPMDMRVAYADASPSQARAACALVLQTVEAEHRLFYQLFGVASRQLPDDERKSAASMSGNAGTKPSSRVRGPQEYMLDGDQAGLTCVGASVRVFS